jgi:lipid-binding SYLF domain-containing protein
MLKFNRSRAFTPLAGALAGIVIGALPAAAQQIGHKEGLTPRPELDAKVASSIEKCAEVAPSCADAMKTAAGALVFPSVVTVDLLVGGSGGKGALVQNGMITAYYNIGEASAGAQMGVKNATQVYILRDESTLQNVTGDGQWQVGAAADLTVFAANATASTQSSDPLVYVFDANGLNAGANVSALKIWKSDES